MWLFVPIFTGIVVLPTTWTCCTASPAGLWCSARTTRIVADGPPDAVLSDRDLRVDVNLVHPSASRTR